MIPVEAFIIAAALAGALIGTQLAVVPVAAAGSLREVGDRDDPFLPTPAVHG